jgi:aryl-alcohol dehydrogenase-like predicted oxidoreductase
VLGTKYTVQTEPDPNSAGNHRKSLVRSLERSLRRLRTDYLDLLWVHARDTLTPVEEVMRALDDQVRAGKVLYVGVSDWPAWEISQATTLAELRGWSPSWDSRSSTAFSSGPLSTSWCRWHTASTSA